MVSKLSVPADPAWAMVRVAALLEPFYDKGTPPIVKQMDAEDWAAALAKYPRWAIQNAARWWKGEDNENRRKRPLEGDIAARCRFEMGAIYAAERILSNPPVVAEPTQPREVAPEDAETRRAIAARVMASYRTGNREAAE